MTVAEPKKIRVGGAEPYDVLVGTHLLGEIVDLVTSASGVRRVLIIHAPTLTTMATSMRVEFEDAGLEAFSAELPDAEEAKTAEVAAFCWRVLGEANFTRSDLIVTVGGGATSDLGGFVAATWLRGIRAIHVATTLLGMVDAAIGGKTAINTNQGKNLVGAFASPVAVVCDLDVLRTLSPNDFRAGLAEVVKCGFIADPRILELVETNPLAALNPKSAVVRELVERAISVKAAVVAADPKEAGEREVLNYGHTFGHAIELVERYRWRHGAAVAVGMTFAAELGRLAGYLDDDLVERHRTILTSLGLPIAYREGQWDRLYAAMRRDKKTRGNVLRFIILAGIGKPMRLEGPDPALLTAAYAEVTEGAV